MSLQQVTPLDSWAYPYAESRLSKDVKCHVAESRRVDGVTPRTGQTNQGRDT